MVRREFLAEIEKKILENLSPRIRMRISKTWADISLKEKIFLYFFLFLTAVLPESLRLLVRRRFFSRLQVALFDYKNFPVNGMLRSRVTVRAADIEAVVGHDIENAGDGRDPAVSIIIATYNRSGLLFNSVLSILKGDYENFEVIVVDDCSSDETPAVARQLMRLDSRISYIRSAANMGPVRARDEGLKVSGADFIAFHDDDDIARPNRISAPLDFLLKNPQADACYCDFDMIVDGIRFKKENRLPFTRENYLKRKIMIGSAIMLYRKEALIKCPFSPEYNHAIDFDWVLRATRHGLTIGHCSANVLDYYIDSNLLRLAGRNPVSKKQHKVIIKREKALQL